MARRPSAFSRYCWLVFRLSRPVPVPGFDLRAVLPTATDAALIQLRIGAALALIETHAPRLHAYLRRDLPRIFALPTHNIAMCLGAVGICVLQFDYVIASDTTAEMLALTLVHEGAHARLERAGFEYREGQRARIERLCVRTELALAKRLPGADALVTDAERRLAYAPEMWTNEAFRKRTEHSLKRLGMSGAIGYQIVRVLQRFNDLFSRRAV